MLLYFTRLRNAINNISSSNNVFFSQLIELLFFEGQAEVLRFIEALVNSDFVGWDAKNKLNNFIAEIEVLEPRQWENQFHDLTNNKSLPSVSNLNHTEELKAQQDKKLIVP
ncbi:hypothetical protein HCG51_09320 [Tolypothrix sp. PCC 7910]|uniref:hypothetical protein n=1 Tax=Tolypothrix sp. PCC 7910 TaxID=2099387 RepID=UPI0014278B81|nr:hypothetical protein [Tolypothrix sp. PCC 7910]QIR36917.1 hypothetical protein HCG51_09320 [Tolypothrix sp. PCC 7910]